MGASEQPFGETEMNRDAVNPWDWSVQYGYNQAELLTGVSKQLMVSGQTSVDGEGAPQHIGDMRGQMGLSLDNLQAVLEAAGMGLGDVVKLGVYTTDLDAAMANFDLLAQRFGPLGVRPPMTLLGVSRLALPPLMFEIEAVAVQ